MFDIEKYTFGKEAKLPGSEADLQRACVQYLEWHPKKPLFFHCPNGGHRNKIEAAKLKAQGVKSGVPDLMIIEPTNFLSGLAVELKAKGGRLQKEQLEWLEKLDERGYQVAVCYTFDSFKTILDIYLEYAR